MSPRKEAPADDPGPDERRGRGREAVSRVADILQNRDAIVQETLDRLEQVGLIDHPLHEKLWGRYRQGDERTRLFIQDLVLRILGVGKPGTAGAAPTDDVADGQEAQAALEALRKIPDTDPETMKEKSGEIDIDRMVAGGEEPNILLRALSWFPVKVLEIRRKLVFFGLVLIVLVAVALVFPAHARLVLFYGFLALVGILGLYLIKLAWMLDRTMKRYGVDVKGLSRLDPAERRILLVRRFVKRTLENERIADFVERRMRNDGGAARKARKAAKSAARNEAEEAKAAARAPTKARKATERAAKAEAKEAKAAARAAAKDAADDKKAAPRTRKRTPHGDAEAPPATKPRRGRVRKKKEDAEGST
ncbi:MAG: hypothetical protein KY455_07930 [Euryarchaeota archaeon]|nr:hypothetical protein [Euryarchaeota archaeon]